MLKYCYALGLLLHSFAFAQKIAPENLGPKVKLYWDANNKKVHSTGSYFIDELHPETTEKHGKWLFYSVKGVLEEERYFYRNRMHGKQTLYYPNKKIKQQYFAKYNVPDSIFKEYNEEGTLTIQGMYRLGSPEGTWQYYYTDSSLWKEEFVSNDTTYLLSYFENDSAHTKTVDNGFGSVITYYSNGMLKEAYNFKNGLRSGAFIEQLATGLTSISGSFEQGKKQGVWTYYFENGTIEKQESYLLDSLDGDYVVYLFNGSLKTKGKYMQGKKEGEWVWYMDDGNVEMRGSFKKGLQDGQWNYYFSTGELSYIAHFKMGLKDGEWHYFYRDGTDFKKGEYREDLKSGPWKTWYEDGTLLMDGSYEFGKEVGQWKNFWPNGRLKNQSYYDKGLLNGAWYSFTENGKLSLFGRYKKGNKTGKWTEFYSNGKTKEVISYKIHKVKNATLEVVAIGLEGKQSVRHGPYKAYSQIDYTLKENGNYKKGQKTGKWVNYYPGGVIPTVVSNFKKGQLHGDFIQYDRRGTPLNEAHYKNGLKDGWFIVYGKNGSPIVKKMFRQGHELNRSGKEDLFTP